MTGWLRYFLDEDGEPPHTRLRLTFTNGYHLAYVCQRMLGLVSLTESPHTYAREKELGPDALHSDEKQIRSLLQTSRQTAKAASMDQSLLAGIGNVYSRRDPLPRRDQSPR